MTHTTRFFNAALVIFTASGFAGLIYESIWAQYLKLFLGHAAYAQTMVLCIFMGGLALGAALAAKFSGRIRNPLLAYAAVELVIGVMGLVFHGVFTWAMDYHYTHLLPLSTESLIINVIKFALGLLLIGPQTILLGATFPLMTAGVLRIVPDASGNKIALLYFSNSTGAAVGVLAAAFVLIAWSGLPGAMLTAALINIGVALFAWLLVKSSQTLQTSAQTDGRDYRPSPARSRMAAPLLATALFTGLASFVYEVVWVRMLSMVLGASTHSFELMLSAFITGLALGSFAIRRWISRIDAPYRFLGYVQIIMGVFALGSLSIYSQSFDWMALLMQGIARTDQGYTVFLIASHLVCFLVMLPTTFMAGMTLPLITSGLLRDGYGERSIGAVYSWNTLGSIIGVLLAIHFLIPGLGLKSALILGAVVDMLAGIVLVFMAAGAMFEFFVVTSAALICVGLAAWGLTLDPRKLNSGVYRYARAQLPPGNEILSHRDGKTATISLVRNGDARSLRINGKPDATIMPFSEQPHGDEVTSVLHAGLGMLYHPNARSAASIGLGSGVTTRMLLKNTRLQSVDTIEIEEQVVSTVRQLSDQVGAVFTDPRSRIIVDDAKSYFAARRSQYDLIFAQPSNPWVSGIASLFTVEFYLRMLDHLANEGVFVQWVQTYETDYESIASVTQALGIAFANYTVYTSDGGDILIVAWKGKKPREPDTALLTTPGLWAEFKRAGVESLPDIEALRIGGRAVIEPLLSSFPAPENSDYFPFLDNRAARARIAASSSVRLDLIRLGTLPLVELLERRERQYQETKMAGLPFATNASAMKNAEAFYRMLANPKTEAQPNARTRANLGLYRAFCNGGSAIGAADALSAFVGLALDSLPYLTTMESRQVQMQLMKGGCLSRIGNAAETFGILIEHVLDRNGTGMKVIGERLIAESASADPRLAMISLDTAMVGAILDGAPRVAIALWQKHGGKYGAGRDIPLGNRLMLSMAGIAIRNQ